MELAISEVVQRASGRKIGLFLSGGIDSCVIAHYMREMRVDFVPVIIRYDHDLNVTDVNNAIRVCDRLNLCPKIIDITHSEFVNYFYSKAMPDYKVASQSLGQLFWATELMGPEYFMISGEGEPRLFVYQTKDVLGMELKPQWTAIVDRFNNITGCHLLHQFYESTSDLYYNYHRHPEVLRLQQHVKDVPDYKHKVWGDEYWNPKLHGFENWCMYYDQEPTPEQTEKLDSVSKWHPQGLFTVNYKKFWSWMLSPDTQAHINDLR